MVKIVLLKASTDVRVATRESCSQKQNQIPKTVPLRFWWWSRKEKISHTSNLGYVVRYTQKFPYPRDCPWFNWGSLCPVRPNYFYLITFTVQLVNVSQLLSSCFTDVCQFCHCYNLLCGFSNKQKGFELSPFQVHYTSRRQLWMFPLFTYCTY